MEGLKSSENSRGAELDDCLRPSALCDFTNPRVQSAAREITKDAKTPREAAIQIFHFVRDQIRLAFVKPSTTASETLRMRRGSCFTKATLQMALLRTVSIPARVRVMTFRGNDPKEWEGILPRIAVSMMPAEFPHYLGEVFLDGRWLMADATFDRALIADIDDWTGEADVCTIAEEAILSNVGAYAFLEEEAIKLDRLYQAPVFLSLNSYWFFWTMNAYLKAQRLKNKLF